MPAVALPIPRLRMFTGTVAGVSRATLGKDPHEVASMFDAVARRYDLTNTVLSLGQDRFWRRAARSALRIGPGDKVLDLAAGTAVSTVELAASGAWCVAADFSVGMLAAGAGRPVPKVGADATRLPFADGVFDAVTISFGLRNIVDHTAGLREMARVTRPGGRLVVCEFSTPTNALFATVYKEYLMQALPRIATAVSSNPDAYVYLAESIRACPSEHDRRPRRYRRHVVHRPSRRQRRSVAGCGAPARRCNGFSQGRRHRVHARARIPSRHRACRRRCRIPQLRWQARPLPVSGRIE